MNNYQHDGENFFPLGRCMLKKIMQKISDYLKCCEAFVSRKFLNYNKFVNLKLTVYVFIILNTMALKDF